MNRMEALITANGFVEPIIDKHGLEPYVLGSSIFNPTSKFTKVDQHLDQVLRIADWLLEGGDADGSPANVSRTAS